MKRPAKYLMPIVAALLLFASDSVAKKDLEDEIENFTVAERAFQDKFYDFARQELEEFIEHYPRSEHFGQALLLLGRSYLELDQPQQALRQFSEILKKEAFKGLKDQALYWSGEVYLRKKELETAAAFYQDLIDRYPQSSLFPYAVYSRTWCHEAQMKFQEAEAGYAQFVARFPDHALTGEAHVRQIICLLRQKKFEEALSISRAFLESHPSSPWTGKILYLRGEIFFEQGEFRSAAKAYEGSLQEEGDKTWRPLARLNLAWSYFKMKETDKAFSLFKELSDDKEVQDGALFGVALCDRLAGKHSEALGILEKLLAHPSQKEWRNKALLEKAEIEYKFSKYPEAAKSYEALLGNAPGVVEATQAHYGLGWAFLKKGDREEAISEFQWVSERASDVAHRVQALCRIGDMYQDRREFKRAIENYQTVLKEYPFALEADYAAYQIAASHLSAGEFAAAIVSYEEMLSKFPKSIYRFLARDDLGMAHFHLGHFETAKSHFLKVRAAHPTDELYFSSLFQLGNCHYNLKEYAKALECFQEIVSKAPDHFAAPARYEMGWCLYQMGKREEALESFQQYLSRYPDSDIAPDVFFWFAEYYEREKQYDRSEEYFKTLTEKFPKSPLADEALFRWSGIASEKKAYHTAMERLDELIRRYPKSPLAGEAVLRKSEILFLVGKGKEGRQLLERLLNGPSQDAFRKRAARKVGDLLKEEGNYADAITYLEKARTGDAYEPNAQIQFEIGECYEALGNTEKALEEFLRLAYLYPKSTYWVMRAYLKSGTLLEKQGKLQEAAQVYEKLAGWHRLEEAEVARERLEWIKKQLPTNQKTP